VQPRTFSRIDYLVLAGSALSAVALVWLFYYRLAPLSSRPGYWVITYAVFLVVYYFVVRQMYGRLQARDRVMTVLVASGAFALFVPLMMIIAFVVQKGISGIDWDFFTKTKEFVGPLDPGGGAFHAIVGTLEQTAVAVVMAVPLAIMTAVFLNEVGGRIARPVRFVVDAMSGVPSIVAGLFIFSVFIVRGVLDFSGLAAALALAVLMLPTVTRTTEEVLRLVPGGLRESALALGAKEWRSTWTVVLPTARAGIVTAIILGMARAVGETAPLIMTSFGSSFLSWTPQEFVSQEQQSLPLYVYRQIGSAQPIDVQRAYTGALVLITIVLILFTIARIVGRPRVGRKRLSRDRLPLFSGAGPSWIQGRRRGSS
jgi:phosphate transport system permease protein